MKIENFILINLNQNISKARRAAYKGNRDRWIIFGLLCSIFVGVIGWFFSVNSNYNMLIQAREETIHDIKEKTRKLKRKIKTQYKTDINLSKKDIELSYKIGEETVPWSEKLIQLSKITPDDMCITKLEYINNTFNISAISKIHKNQKDQKILNDFMALLESHGDFKQEFDDIKIKDTKRVAHGRSPYYSFQISAPLKKKIKNRLNDIIIKESIKKEEVKKTEKDKEKKKYSIEIKKMAKSIDVPNPDDKKIKKFQIALGLFKEGDRLFGHLESRTILKRDEILKKKAKTELEKALKKANQDIASLGDEKIYRKYTKIVREAAFELRNSQIKEDHPLAIQKFQEAVGIANENNSNFGKWDNKTSSIYEDVIQSIIDKK